MHLCTETITIFNPKVNPATGTDEYWPTVIRGCSWFEKNLAAITDSGLKAADEIIIRIPLDADFSGKDYVDPEYYPGADPTQSYTLDSKAWIVKGECLPESLTREGIKACKQRMAAVLGVNDNRRAKAKHWKVIAK